MSEQLIDLPSPFASLAEWKAFLADMEKIAKPRPREVREAISAARAAIRQIVGSGAGNR